MNVHLMPLYTCNYNCEYCYLGSLRQDPRQFNFSKLEEAFSKINLPKYGEFTVNIYGGEIFLINPITLTEVCIKLFKLYPNIHINFATNLSHISARNLNIVFNKLHSLNYNRIDYSISVNPERKDFETLKANLLLMENQPSTILTVVTPKILSMNTKELLDLLCSYDIKFVTFLQYYPSIYNENKYSVSNSDYSEFLIKVFEIYKSSNLPIIINNFEELDDVLKLEYNPYASESIFITPLGELAHTKYVDDLSDEGNHFSTGDCEMFQKIDSVDDLMKYSQNERNYLLFMKNCSNCPYLDHCYAEHIKHWDQNDDCCGHLKLIKYYQEAKNE